MGQPAAVTTHPLTYWRTPLMLDPKEFFAQIERWHELTSQPHSWRRTAASPAMLKDRFKMSSARLLRSPAGPAEAVVGDRGTRARRALGADRSAAPAAEAAPPPLSGSPADR